MYTAARSYFIIYFKGGNKSWFLFLICFSSCPHLRKIYSVYTTLITGLMRTSCEMERNSFSASSNKLLQRAHTHTHIHAHKQTNKINMQDIYVCVTIQMCTMCKCVLPGLQWGLIHLLSNHFRVKHRQQLYSTHRDNLVCLIGGMYV